MAKATKSLTNDLSLHRYGDNTVSSARKQSCGEAIPAVFPKALSSDWLYDQTPQSSRPNH